MKAIHLYNNPDIRDELTRVFQDFVNLASVIGMAEDPPESNLDDVEALPIYRRDLVTPVVGSMCRQMNCANVGVMRNA